MGETLTGTDFNKLIIAGIKTKCGKVYDLKGFNLLNLYWWLWELTGSNRRPSACKADALNQLS